MPLRSLKRMTMWAGSYLPLPLAIIALMRARRCLPCPSMLMICLHFAVKIRQIFSNTTEKKLRAIIFGKMANASQPMAIRNAL